DDTEALLWRHSEPSQAPAYVVVVFAWMDDVACRSVALRRGVVRLGDLRDEVRFRERKGRFSPMNKSDIQLIFEYDRWANRCVFQAASALSAEQLARDLGGSFRSVR